MHSQSLFRVWFVLFIFVTIQCSLFAVTQIAPRGSITQTTPIFSWNADLEADWYLLWVVKEDTSETLFNSWIHASNITSEGVSNCITDIQYVQGEKYEWWCNLAMSKEWVHGVME